MKNKPFRFPFDNKWLWAAITSAIIIPSLAMAWNQIGKVWASPKKIETVEQAVISQANTQKTLEQIVIKQEQKNELQDEEIKHGKELVAAQLEALKEIVARLKK